MKTTTVPMQYDGEFVLTKSGKKDFGEITPALAKKIHRQAGKIRLRIGVERKGQKGNYGAMHIERTNRLTDIQSAGFANARDFIEFVCKDFDAIFDNGKGLIIFKKGKKHNATYVELIPVGNEEFYDVKTAVPSNRNFVKNKPLLWQKPNNNGL